MSEFWCCDMKTQHLTGGFASLSVRAHRSTVWIVKHLPQNRDLASTFTSFIIQRTTLESIGRTTCLLALLEQLSFWIHMWFLPSVLSVLTGVLIEKGCAACRVLTRQWRSLLLPSWTSIEQDWADWKVICQALRPQTQRYCSLLENR